MACQKVLKNKCFQSCRTISVFAGLYSLVTDTCILAVSRVNHLWYSCQVTMAMQSSISWTHTHSHIFQYVCHSSDSQESNLNLQSHQLFSSLMAQVWHLHCRAVSPKTCRTTPWKMNELKHKQHKDKGCVDWDKQVIYY